jgi:hypothetical protein
MSEREERECEQDKKGSNVRENVSPAGGAGYRPRPKYIRHVGKLLFGLE